MENYQILTQSILPLSIHGINPRSIMSDYAWEKIKKQKQLEANHHCMACNEYVPHVPGNYLECHEVYDIDMENHEFKIKDYVCLCKKCHDYIHRGRLLRLLQQGAVTQDYYHEVITRGDKFLKDNNLTKQDLPMDEIRNPKWCLAYGNKRYSNIKN